MFEEMTVGEVLKDLQSIKVPPKTRDYIDRARMYLQGEGGIPGDVQMQLRRIYNRYKKQVRELHSARARARKTNGLKSLGISSSEAAKRVERRKAADEARRRDVGF